MVDRDLFKFSVSIARVTNEFSKKLEAFILLNLEPVPMNSLARLPVDTIVGFECSKYIFARQDDGSRFDIIKNNIISLCKPNQDNANDRISVISYSSTLELLSPLQKSSHASLDILMNNLLGINACQDTSLYGIQSAILTLSSLISHGANIDSRNTFPVTRKSVTENERSWNRIVLFVSEETFGKIYKIYIYFLLYLTSFFYLLLSLLVSENPINQNVIDTLLAQHTILVLLVLPPVSKIDLKSSCWLNYKSDSNNNSNSVAAKHTVCLHVLRLSQYGMNIDERCERTNGRQGIRHTFLTSAIMDSLCSPLATELSGDHIQICCVYIP